VEYENETAGLDRQDLEPDPVLQWQRWCADAVAAGVTEPTAMVVATTGLDGRPDARTVLARGVDERGITFFTNYDSPKSRQIAAAPDAAVVFPWHDLQRQVRARGRAARVDDHESDGYFASRPRGAQIGAWASPQSQEIADRGVLDARVAEITARFDDQPVSRPPFWGGWRIVPEIWEFWQGRPDRLHDRFRYTPADDGTWRITRLAP
jgi:pyridoxamine 5'-phosphate oxidase